MRLNHAAERLGGSPRLCSAPKVPVLARALAARWQGSLPAGCRHAAGPCGWTMRLNHAAERLGGSPRLCSAPKVPALARALAARWQGSLPAGCRHAAGPCGWTMRLNHAAERLGGSPRLCFAPKVRVLARALAVSVCPQAAAMRLG